MQKQIPILFSTAMVQSLLAGRKTQTRRIVKGTALQWLDRDGFTLGFVANPDNSLCPYGKPGDIIWVRESWRWIDDVLGSGYYDFRANKEIDLCKWKPSIHMPKEASRIWLQVESIRVERAQDITQKDAVAEGIEVIRNNEAGDNPWYRMYYNKPGIGAGFPDPRQSFQSLWQSINGEESWNSNPWVWVVSFKVLSTNGKPTELCERDSSSVAML